MRFSGHVIRGHEFKQKLSEELQFLLVPEDTGWTISVAPIANPDENFAKISTGPLHGPSPLDLDAVFFRNGDNSGPRNDGYEASMEREFSFVLSRSEYVKVGEAVNLAEYANNASKKDREAAENLLGTYLRGSGTFKISDLKLSPPDKGKLPWIESLDFSADICIPQIVESNKKPN